MFGCKFDYDIDYLRRKKAAYGNASGYYIRDHNSGKGSNSRRQFVTSNIYGSDTSDQKNGRGTVEGLVVGVKVLWSNISKRQFPQLDSLKDELVDEDLTTYRSYLQSLHDNMVERF
ncbi:Hypothetical predicted protein [Octopus vulgaris]|uniref:Uncharacterized protein n=1 Tax=Octopus vulgaris TaxID=6645 RepID=A0AA36FEW7_OCTVU|nr:Hypothetical predicted protein [Octopus vulgaris]